MCTCPVPPQLVPNQTLRCQVVDISALSASGDSAEDSASDQANEVVEQFFSLLDERGQPVDGFRYDLYKDGAIHTQAADYTNGETTKISGDGNLKLITWFNTDGASRHG